MEYVLGIDLGTSSIKGLLFSRQGKIVNSCSFDYPVLLPKSGYSEQDPMQWRLGLDYIFKEMSQEVSNFTLGLKALSISGQMHSLVTLDDQDQIVRPAILWNDVRTNLECQKISTSMDIHKITNNVALEGFTLPKIIWMQNHEKKLWNSVNKVMLPKDYLNYFLTGNFVIDKSDASGTIMMDFTTQNWSEEIINNFDINRKILPKIIESESCIGLVKDQLKNKYNFKNNVKVFAGGADNALSALGAGIISKEKVMCSIGTSGVMLKLQDYENINTNKNLHHFNHVVKDQQYSMGVTLSAGASLAWFRDTFLPHATFDEVLDMAKDSPIGANNLLFAPYIMGERTPYPDANIKGAFIGISNNHTIHDFARAVIEGITFSLNDCLNLLDKKDVTTVISVGGGSKNKMWLEIQANIFNYNVQAIANNQGPATGAAIQCAVGLNWFNDYQEAIESFVQYGEVISPNEDFVSTYKQVYDKYQSIYPNIKNI